MVASPTPWIACLAFLSLTVLFFSARELGGTLSPQGCRMSWMSPSYVQQIDFNTSWSPLADRYSLWLYREVGWDAARVGDSLPVLFVPGNAGSSHQVRSIASSATRQYFSSPLRISPEFSARSNVYKPLDFYAVEFNEDLSAFHGTTLESQIDYTSKAVAYILSLYPPNTQIIVLGHSMGGVVATSLLPSREISAVITMSTPFTLPPARFDNNIDSIYANIARVLENNSTPIVSLCGGATDMMIPSESCILPPNSRSLFRRTVFSSALEGAWTGVGHREMVWCHQVRWRVARAALELAPFASEDKRVEVLDRWLRDGHTLPSLDMDSVKPLDEHEAEHAIILPVGQKLVVDGPKGTRAHLLPIPAARKRFTLLVSGGAVLSLAPEHHLPFSVAVYQCSGQFHCTPFRPDTLKLLPTPAPKKPFPVPHEGSDESEGVVLLEAQLDGLSEDTTHLAVKIEQGDGRGWVIADFADEHDEVNEPASTTCK
ncbi:hypothetical protein EST38_g427 [Candolleomyces aberdarensis]|uniref:GPI inositol-deacylase n=1 Tax=Candolleomyces aberdarensis TaxID=2316362 RepID=A0A4Q2E044_9AGAR|nr:hypothetical protein EST38_g427 [Candolleomyces aberdarensis]